TIKQIPFPAVILPCGTQPGAIPGAACYVTADGAAEERAFDRFMTATPAATHPASGGKTNAGGPKTPRRGFTGLAKLPPPPKPRPRAAVTPDPADGRAQVQALGHVGMPVFYPRSIATGSSYCASTIFNCYVEISSP